MSENDDSMNEPLALFGGTFDPVHYGHLRCADEARRKLKLNELFLLPSGTPPHRDAPRATARQRLEMLCLGSAEFPRLAIDDREVRRDGPSYMVDTLHEIREEFPYRSLILLIGQDAANLLHQWHCWENLFELAHLVVLTRPGEKAEYRHDINKQIQQRSCTDLQTLHCSSAGEVLHLEVTPIDISATTIKSIIRLGRSPGAMLPTAVMHYINQNRLYFRA